MELKRFRYLRVVQGMSQDKIAKIIGVSQAKISRAEKGYIELKAEDQKKVAKIFNCKPEELFVEE